MTRVHFIRKTDVSLAQKDYDPTKANDALAYQGVFGLGNLSPAENAERLTLLENGALTRLNMAYTKDEGTKKSYAWKGTNRFAKHHRQPSAPIQTAPQKLTT